MSESEKIRKEQYEKTLATFGQGIVLPQTAMYCGDVGAKGLRETERERRQNQTITNRLNYLQMKHNSEIKHHATGPYAKPKPRFTLAKDFVLLDEHLEHITGPSETVEGDAYTVQELIDRMNNGLIPDVQQNPQYDDDASHDSEDLEKISNMDPGERQEMLQSWTERNDISKNQLSLYETEKKDAEKQRQKVESKSRKYKDEQEDDDQSLRIEEDDEPDDKKARRKR
ncbi:MAG: hypothetical protein [Microvirus sp.]|nr:MAG: hypothetical protein [Microvirus sp.]